MTTTQSEESEKSEKVEGLANNEPKDWLIRTQDFQILGPLRRHKVIELLEKGALNPRDEICQGNGYWFWVEEKKLVQEFIYEGKPQPFNPINESPFHSSTSILSAYDYTTDTQNNQQLIELPGYYNPGSDFHVTHGPSDDSDPNLLRRKDDQKDDQEIKIPLQINQELSDQWSEDETYLPSSDDLEYPESSDLAPSQGLCEVVSEEILPVVEEKNTMMSSVQERPPEPLKKAIKRQPPPSPFPRKPQPRKRGGRWLAFFVLILACLLSAYVISTIFLRQFGDFL